MPDPIQLFGGAFSPYSMKLRALMRYRGIPFVWISRDGRGSPPTPEVPVSLIPILRFPGEEKGMIDTTFQIRHLETLFSDPDRSVVPDDPVVAFLDAMIEDYADEWLTKAMFHFRWAFQPDIDKASALLPYPHNPHLSPAEMRQASQYVGDRQTGRLGVVGSTPETAPLIEESYRRLLRILDARLSAAPFVLGERPGTADFAIFGQLSQLALFDPTSAALALEESPRVVGWCYFIEDLSGIRGGESWPAREQAATDLRPFLEEFGRTYAPFLIANANALREGAAQVECEIDGRKWVQQSFPYQGKCLAWLREQHSALSADDRSAVDQALRGTGCEGLFA